MVSASVLRSVRLSAQRHARRRLVAALLSRQPGAAGPLAADAPRPWRLLAPTLALGTASVAAAGVVGALAPTAPADWRTVNALLVDRETSARYVMLHGVLHPVRNLASARLLLAEGSRTVTVADGVLNAVSVPHGAPVGIPDAPDDLPGAAEAGRTKTWAACLRTSPPPPAAAGPPPAAPRSAEPSAASAAPVLPVARPRLFVLGRGQQALVRRRLSPDQAVYVRTPDGAQYLVDAGGTAHALLPGPGPAAAGSAPPPLLVTAVLGGDARQPDQVPRAWLETLRQGDPIGLPRLPRAFDGYVPALGPGVPRRPGAVFRVTDRGRALHFVVLPDGVHPVSAFAARLLAVGAGGADGGVEPSLPLTAVAGAARLGRYPAGTDWPEQAVEQVPAAAVLCSVYDGPSGSGSGSGSGPGAGFRPLLGLWTGADYPVAGPSAGADPYVTPGSGLVLREVAGTDPGLGPVDLLTDAGRRHRLPQGTGEQGLLGYGAVRPEPVPVGWAALLPVGPELSRAASGAVATPPVDPSE